MIWLSVNLDILMQNFPRSEKILPLAPTDSRGIAVAPERHGSLIWSNRI